MLLDAAGFRLDVDVCRRPRIGAAATATACRSSSQCMVSWIKLVWHERIAMTLTIGSMYGIYANIYHQYTPNVSIYIYHTWILWVMICLTVLTITILRTGQVLKNWKAWIYMKTWFRKNDLKLQKGVQSASCDAWTILDMQDVFDCRTRSLIPYEPGDHFSCELAARHWELSLSWSTLPEALKIESSTG